MLTFLKLNNEPQNYFLQYYQQDLCDQSLQNHQETVVHEHLSLIGHQVMPKRRNNRTETIVLIIVKWLIVYTLYLCHATEKWRVFYVSRRHIPRV